jgi:hypothetical protein
MEPVLLFHTLIKFQLEIQEKQHKMSYQQPSEAMQGGGDWFGRGMMQQDAMALDLL